MPPDHAGVFPGRARNIGHYFTVKFTVLVSGFLNPRNAELNEQYSNNTHNRHVEITRYDDSPYVNWYYEFFQNLIMRNSRKIRVTRTAWPLWWHEERSAAALPA